MTFEEARVALSELEKKEFAYRHAAYMINYDAVTGAPKNTDAPRSVTLGVLSEAEYSLATGEETLALLDFLESNADRLTDKERRQLELKQKNLRELRRIPMDEYVEYTRLLNEAQSVWHKAKDEDDYAAFEPYLAKIVAANRRFASLVEPDKDAYDYCLDKYEEGLTQAVCDEFFGALKARLVPLIKRLGELPQPETDFLKVAFPEEKQKMLSEWLMDIMLIDKGHCVLETTEHPFTTDFSKHDVRITTHYYENEFTAAMYSTIHEGGHALYELHTADEYAYTVLGTGVSMGVHESQSRFYENLIGRSREFISLIYPKLTELCPKLSAHTAEDFYRAVNTARPSLIRIEADELTYFLHIIIRYELEKGLMSGAISTKELPGEWNRLYKEYLGIDVPDDKRGVLQDTHWSGGSIGYFPSYALGSAYGAQLMAKLRESVDVPACVSKGDLAPINAWLEERIWRYGALHKPTALMKKAFDRDFDAEYYIAYLEAKAADVYGL